MTDLVAVLEKCQCPCELYHPFLLCESNIAHICPKFRSHDLIFPSPTPRYAFPNKVPDKQSDTGDGPALPDTKPTRYLVYLSFLLLM